MIEKLPKGSYCSFISNDICGWSNGDNNDNSVGKWVIEHDGKSSYIKADFLQLKTPFGKSITIKSPTFQHIPLYHSQHNSAYFNSCLVSKSIIKINFKFNQHSQSDVSLRIFSNRILRVWSN